MAGVSVLYFAALRDLAGTGSEELGLAVSPISVAEMRALLQQRHPRLQGRLQGVRVAVNEEFVDEASSICEGDTVALIPPVSGG